MNNINTHTAGIIIIGNEILSGKVQDINSHYLAAELRSSGVDVKKISVIPDEIDIIAEETKGFSASYDFVITTGGVGPTHDDVTMEGIAKGFGVELVCHPEIRKVLSSIYNSFNDAVLKMANVPDGSVVEFIENMKFPVVNFKNIFIFPGIPEYLKDKFHLIRNRFSSSPFYLKKIFIKARESDIAAALSEIASGNKGVNIGSYPVLENDGFNIIVTVESKSPSSLKNAADQLIGKLPERVVVAIE